MPYFITIAVSSKIAASIELFFFTYLFTAQFISWFFAQFVKYILESLSKRHFEKQVPYFHRSAIVIWCPNNGRIEEQTWDWECEWKDENRQNTLIWLYRERNDENDREKCVRYSEVEDSSTVLVDRLMKIWDEILRRDVESKGLDR